MVTGEASVKAGKYTGWPQERFDRLERKIDNLTEAVTALLQAQVDRGGAIPGVDFAVPESLQQPHPRSLDPDGWARMVARHPEAALVMPWDAMHALARDPGEDAAG